MRHCQPQAFKSHESDSPKNQDLFCSLLDFEPGSITASTFSLQKMTFLNIGEGAPRHSHHPWAPGVMTVKSPLNTMKWVVNPCAASWD